MHPCQQQDRPHIHHLEYLLRIWVYLIVDALIPCETVCCFSDMLWLSWYTENVDWSDVFMRVGVFTL